MCFPKDDVTLSSFSSKYDYDIVSVQSEGKVERSVPQGIFCMSFSLNIYIYMCVCVCAYIYIYMYVCIKSIF